MSRRGKKSSRQKEQGPVNGERSVLLRSPTSERAVTRPGPTQAVSPILSASTRVLVPVIGLASVVILFQGHNVPGGGFIGGLTLSAVIALYALTFGAAAARKLLWLDPMTLLAGGLSAALVSGLFSPQGGFLAARWTSVAIPGLEPLKLGTPMLFDVGVFLVVVGGACLMLLTLMEDDA